MCGPFLRAFLDLQNHDPYLGASLSAGKNVREGGRMMPGLYIRGYGENMFGVTVADGTEVLVGKSSDSSAVVLSSKQGRPAVQVLGSDRKIWWATR
jgi:hypothetical protein